MYRRRHVRGKVRRVGLRPAIQQQQEASSEMQPAPGIAVVLTIGESIVEKHVILTAPVSVDSELVVVLIPGDGDDITVTVTG